MKPFDRECLLTQLKRGVKDISLMVNDAQCEQLINYLELLQKWNAVYNLTAVRDPAQMITHHLLDCLATLPYFSDVHTVLDVGSGGGLPGIALAIARPDMQVSMIDVVHKKTAFLQQAKAELGLGNVDVYSGRVEALQREEKFDVITSRAFADLPLFVSLTEHLLKKEGRYLAMKGAVPQVEIAQLPDKWMVSDICRLTVPGLQAERHLIIVKSVVERGEK